MCYSSKVSQNIKDLARQFSATMDYSEVERLLMETEPDTFWETPHYSGYPAVLVRYGSPSRERIELVIRRAWWDRASKAQQAAFGTRP